VTPDMQPARPAIPAKALLLAGGLGTRLRPVTERIPKCLVPVAGRPLLDYWFDRLCRTEIRDVLINTHHLAGAVRRYIEDVHRHGEFRVTESFEPVLLGSAGTIHANRGFADGARDCLVIYADNLSRVDLSDLMEFHRRHGDPITMLLFRTPIPEACGIAELDPEGRVVRFIEKPKWPPSDLANAGVYVMTAAAYREIADLNTSDIGFDVLPRFVGRMRGRLWTGYHRDIGSLESLRRAEEEVRKWGGAAQAGGDA
jgi:NDP-sugar pyrophosphorylase family protein